MAFFKSRRFVSVIGRKSAVPEGLWIKCPGCKQAIYKPDIDQNLHVCPACNHHYRISARKRIELTVDPDSFEETHKEIRTVDPLEFTVGDVTYPSKIDKARDKSGVDEALLTGYARIGGTPLVLGVMDFAFRGGSMASVVGEKFCRAAQDALERRIPLVVFVASGGARMEEGILSLMQMAKTSDAVRRLNEAGILYISVLTDPTSGGVWASFASIGDINIAEPKAYIGFAGARLIQGALGVKLPEGFQRAEYQLKNGFIDKIVPRSEMREMLIKLLGYLYIENTGDTCVENEVDAFKEVAKKAVDVDKEDEATEEVIDVDGEVALHANSDEE